MMEDFKSYITYIYMFSVLTQVTSFLKQSNMQKAIITNQIIKTLV